MTIPDESQYHHGTAARLQAISLPAVGSLPAIELETSDDNESLRQERLRALLQNIPRITTAARLNDAS